MTQRPLLDLSFSADLSDEAADEIFAFLEALTLAFDEHYFAQISRHRRAIHPKRSELSDQPWEDDPF
jgi:hypothetical protein